MTSDDASIRARKPKLTVDEQIDHLRSKGVTFVSSKLSRYHQSPSLVPPISKERYRE